MLYTQLICVASDVPDAFDIEKGTTKKISLHIAPSLGGVGEHDKGDIRMPPSASESEE